MYEHIFAETPGERAKRYRELARAAEESAARESLPSIRAAYFRSAERWDKLASLMELGKGYSTHKSEKAETPKQQKKARGWTIYKQRKELLQPALRYEFRVPPEGER